MRSSISNDRILVTAAALFPSVPSSKKRPNKGQKWEDCHLVCHLDEALLEMSIHLARINQIAVLHSVTRPHWDTDETRRHPVKLSYDEVANCTLFMHEPFVHALTILPKPGKATVAWSGAATHTLHFDPSTPAGLPVKCMHTHTYTHTHAQTHTKWEKLTVSIKLRVEGVSMGTSKSHKNISKTEAQSCLFKITNTSTSNRWRSLLPLLPYGV